MRPYSKSNIHILLVRKKFVYTTTKTAPQRAKNILPSWYNNRWEFWKYSTDALERRQLDGSQCVDAMQMGQWGEYN